MLKGNGIRRAIQHADEGANFWPRFHGAVKSNKLLEDNNATVAYALPAAASWARFGGPRFGGEASVRSKFPPHLVLPAGVGVNAARGEKTRTGGVGSARRMAPARG